MPVSIAGLSTGSWGSALTPPVEKAAPGQAKCGLLVRRGRARIPQSLPLVSTSYPAWLVRGSSISQVRLAYYLLVLRERAAGGRGAQLRLLRPIPNSSQALPTILIFFRPLLEAAIDHLMTSGETSLSQEDVEG